MTKLNIILAFILSTTVALADTKCFVVKEQERLIVQEGDCKLRHSPCSTFKIPISVMGYNEGILIDETHPLWPYQKGYLDALDVWKQPHNPKTWMQNSVVWYSQLITTKLGEEKFKHYLQLFHYGNEDADGEPGQHNGLTQAWLTGALAISGFEQIAFLQKLIAETLPVSQSAQAYTKQILFLEEFPQGWKLYGKTGSGNLLRLDGTRDPNRRMGWFIGWIEKGDRQIAFAHYIEDTEPTDGYGGPRAKAAAKEKLLDLISTI